ncbi:hypothetical protein P3S67_019768 [Capsicum chacoense]
MKIESLDGGWISLKVLFDRFDPEEGFEKYQGQLNNKEDLQKWKECNRFAFMVAFLGRLVFLERDGNIDIRLAGVVQALTTMDIPTLVPIILGDIFRALTKCKKGVKYFEGVTG